MTKLFLLTAHARSVSSLAIAQLSDDKCYAMLCESRWGSTEIVVCPKCQVRHKAYSIASRKQWQWKHCFSVISSTIFAHHKLLL
ncbi:transposase [Bartonella sp. CM120XJJH]|uniref:transposase n=1 Tax=Bartonella sp. CM120XJJH TaxID=3243544 RepID=UPI0035D0DD39